MKGSKGYFKKLNKIVKDKLRPIFEGIAVSLLKDAMESKEHGDLTGNTLTSFTAGVYRDNKLVKTINLLTVSSLERPRLKKLSKDDGFISVERYDDGEIMIVNSNSLIETDKRYGYQTAKDFLKSYSPNNVKGWSVVLTTGTEYSEYIEETRNLNVLTETFMNSSGIASSIIN